MRLALRGLDWALARRIIGFGLPTFLILSTDSIILIILNTVLQRYGGPGEGDVLVTCATIVQSWFLLISMPMGGITAGCQSVVSYNFGAGNIERIKRSILYIALLSLIFCVLMTAAAHTRAAELFVRLFTQDAETARRSVGFIQVFTAMIIPLAIQYTLVDETTAPRPRAPLARLLPAAQERLPRRHTHPPRRSRRGADLLVRAHSRRRRLRRDELPLLRLHPKALRRRAGQA